MKRFLILSLCSLPLALAGGGMALAGGVLRASAEQSSGAKSGDGKARGVDDLDWIAGQWQGNGLGGTVEEVWLRPSGGSMTGMFRLVQRDGVGFHQFMLLEEQDGQVSLRLQHFNKGYAPWEKNGPLVFELMEAQKGRAVFESPDPKQTPSRLTYQVVTERGLRLSIESPNALGGPLSFEALYERAPAD